jgi:predicted RNA-binding protein
MDADRAPGIPLLEVNSMCEANAYLLKDGKEELVMESLDTVEPDNGTLRLTNIFGEQKFIRGKITRLALVDHKVFIEKAEG